MLIITIWNDGTGTEEIANYEWKAYVNRKLIDSGNVNFFKRSRGWKNLVKEILKKG